VRNTTADDNPLEGFDLLSESMPLGRPRDRWENYINIFLKAIEWRVVACNAATAVL
jgi:hypothetical protein